MKVALLRVGEAADGRETNRTGVYPPLGLAYLGAVLRQAGHQPVLLDGEALGVGVSSLLDRVPPDVGLIGVTSTTLSWPAVQRSAPQIRHRFPAIPLIVGGPQVTAFPEWTLEWSQFDLGVIGEGEWTLLDLVDRVADGRPLTGVPGTVARDGRDVTVVPGGRFSKNLDEIPMPALDLLPLDRYSSVVVRSPFVTLLASRGCPYRCAFCSQIYTGDKFRAHSAQRILAELERAERDFHAQEVVLFDETFGANRRVAREVCEGISSRGFRFRWNARTRIDLLDRELLSQMRRSGCYMLHLGIESGSQATLDSMRKGITLEKIEEVVRVARELRYKLHGYFMLGYPGETRADVERTAAFSRRLPLDWASYTITIPNPHTPLQEEAEATGLLRKDFWRDYVAGRTDGVIPYLSSPECPVSYLKKAKRDAYLRFYLRPGTLLSQGSFVLRSGGARRILDAGLLWLRELR